MSLGRKNLRDILEKTKMYLGDEYEILKYKKRVMVGIRITDDIDEKLKYLAKSFENGTKRKRLVEKIIDENIYKAIEIKEIKNFKQYKADKRIGIEILLVTAEEIVNLSESILGRSRNRVVNAILDDYLNNSCKLFELDYEEVINKNGEMYVI